MTAEPELPAPLRAAYDAVNRADWEAMAGLLASDTRVDRALGLGSVEGRDGVIGFLRPDMFEFQRFAVQPGVANRGERWLVPVVSHARARASEIELVEDWFHVFTLRDGQIAHLSIHRDRDEAVAALGS